LTNNSALDVGDRADESEKSDSVTIVSARVPAAAMFASKLVDPLLVNPTAGARAHFLVRVQPPLADQFAQTGPHPQQHWRKASFEQAKLVPKTWYDGKLAVGESTARGQCMFSSVAMLLCGRRDDEVALWLRARCVVELLEQWPLYEAWFGVFTVRDVLTTLAGINENSQLYGFAWPVAETLWVLANVLQRRIVVVRKLQQHMAAAAGGDRPFVVLPARHPVEQWRDAPPLVVLHSNADHYQPLSGVVWVDAELRRLPFGADAITPALNAALRPLVVGQWCSQPAASFAVE
jgi:hypothetical protein